MAAEIQTQNPKGLKIYIAVMLTLAVLLLAAIAGALAFGSLKLKNESRIISTKIDNFNNQVKTINTNLQNINNELVQAKAASGSLPPGL